MSDLVQAQPLSEKESNTVAETTSEDEVMKAEGDGAEMKPSASPTKVEENGTADGDSQDNGAGETPAANANSETAPTDIAAEDKEQSPAAVETEDQPKEQEEETHAPESTDVVEGAVGLDEITPVETYEASKGTSEANKELSVEPEADTSPKEVVPPTEPDNAVDEGAVGLDEITPIETYEASKSDQDAVKEPEPEATPTVPETTPIEPEATPTEPEAMPSETEATPAEPEATPTEQEVTPTEKEATPTEQEATPTKPEAITTDAETASIEHKPAEEEPTLVTKDTVSEEKQTTPKKREATPTKKRATPTKKRTTPTKKEAPPPDVESRVDEPMETDKPQLGLLERPVEIQTGKRSRRKVERFTEVLDSPTVPEKKVNIPEGKGCQLADCPIIMEYVDKHPIDSLKNFHRLLFNVAGKNPEVRKNIRKFSGFPFDKDSNEYNRKLTAVSKLGVTVIRSFCDLLALDKTGAKDVLVERVMSYLMSPSADEKQAKEKKPKQPVAGAKRKRGGAKQEVVEKSDEEDAESPEEEEGTGSGSEEEQEEEEEEQPAAKRRRKASPAKASPKKTPAKFKSSKAPAKGRSRATAKGKTTPAKGKAKSPPSKGKSPRRGRGKKQESEEEDENGAPSNKRLKKEIQKILKTADLEKVTMKTVRQQVIDMFPEHDLSDRTAFIRTTVKEILGA